MAGRVFFSVTMSLDGFIAPEERKDDPDAQRWVAQWTGGTTFHVVDDGIEPALDRAREAARDRDVRIAGGGTSRVQQR